MMQTFRVALAAGMVIGVAALAASQQTTQQPAPTPAQPPANTQPAPQTQQPGPQQPAPTAAPAVPPVPATPAAPAAARTFTAACGMLMHPVRPERQKEFEQFLDYVRDAMARSTNPRVRAQVPGWRFFKAAEAGPNGVVLYVFWIDPAVPGAEYALGPILAEVYTDPAQLAEIWALYTGSVTSGGTLLNFAPVPQRPPLPIATPPVSAPAAGQKPGAPAAAATLAPGVTPTPAPAPSVPTKPVTTGVAAPPRC